MPTYQYRCKDCGHEFDIQQSFSDDPLDTCPECAGALKKVYGNVGISFKGSGFYKNDARSGSKSKVSTSSSASSDSNGPSSKESSASSSDSSSSSSSDSSSGSSSSSSSSDKAKSSTPSSSD